VNYTSLRSGPEAYRRAIHEALSSGQPLDSLDLLPQFDQAQITDFLRALDARLERLRPWPEPDFRQIDPPEAWDRLRDAVPIAVIKSPILKMYNTFRTVFRQVSSDPRQEAVVLRLKSGDIIALSATFEPKETIMLLTGRNSSTAHVIDEFVRLTGLPRDKVSPL
jgi:hypothetical protein